MTHLALQYILWSATTLALATLAACSPVTLEDVRSDPASFTELDLSYAALTTLPPYIAKCTNLESISLVGNKLQAFPAELLALPKLRRINLSFNEIDSLTPDISTLQAVEELNLAGNRIRSVPDHVASIRTLRSLDVSWNALSIIPPSFASAPQLREIKAYDDLLTNADSVVGSFRNASVQVDYCLQAFKAQYYLNRAIQYHNAQNGKDAMAYYAKALSFDAGLSVAYGNRGLLRLQTGDVVGALQDFDLSLQIDKQQPVIWLNRGIVRFNRGDKAGACQDFKNAANLGNRQAAEILVANCN